MAKDLKHDFGGYATKVGIKCSDGRTISRDAFSQNDGESVPLVWQHMHNDPNNVLGFAHLENRPDGVYAYCSFNETPSAKQAKELVKHGDITSLSIYANSLVEKSKLVLHGVIREVSLVLAGANQGAKIDNIAFEHSDGSVVDSEDEALIYSGLNLEFDDEEDDDDLKHAEGDKTIGDVFEEMSEDQKIVVYAMVEEALKQAPQASSVKQSAEDDDYIQHTNKGDNNMKKNVFDAASGTEDKKAKLSHDDFKSIFEEAKRSGSLRDAFLAHSTVSGGGPGDDPTWGIQNIDYLFPEATNVHKGAPALIKRDTEWVKDAFKAAHHVPFSRIKSMAADLTADEARAKGYIKGNKKMEEVIPLLKRQTTPTTVYKKQKLDRDDIIDIVDMDVVAWLKVEMRMMLDEELARAVLVGDGRSAASDDKIREDCIRPIYTDDELYSVKVPIASTMTTMAMMDQIILARKLYKGSGNPVMFATQDAVGDMLLLRDTTGRRLYNTLSDVAAALRVSRIIEVPIFEGLTRTDSTTGATLDLVGIIVNMNDYYVGADKGGAVAMFDDFDIDFNQYKYLIETRCSGALVLPHSALVIEREQA